MVIWSSKKTNTVNATRDTGKVAKSSWWSLPKKNLKKIEIYHEGLAHNVKDIILGVDHFSHSQERKRAVKALQHPKTAQGILNILKAMPDPQLPKIEAVNVTLTNSSIPPVEDSLATTETSNSKEVVDPPQINTATTSWFFWRSAHVETQNESKDASAITPSDSPAVVEEKSTGANGSVIVKTIDKLLVFHPPLHQISAYIFWWGYEIYVPNQYMGRLDQAQNVSNAFLGLLQVVAGNVGALHPYFGIISAWVGLQFTIIKSQNTGHGVVLAATWVLPIAIIPRPWDAPIE